jgi:hypothetical protein
MQKLTFIILLTAIFISCEKEIKNQRVDILTKIRDTMYIRKNIRIKQKDGTIEECEIYISNQNDTIINQYKFFPFGKFDTKKSNFYNLDITKTDEPHVYNAHVTLNSFANEFDKNKNEIYSLECLYWQVTEDSSYVSKIKIEQRNNFNFQYKNIKDDQLSGIMWLWAESDSQEGKDMVRIRQIDMLLDNRIKTSNSCLRAFEVDKNNTFSLKR